MTTHPQQQEPYEPDAPEKPATLPASEEPEVSEVPGGSVDGVDARGGQQSSRFGMPGRVAVVFGGVAVVVALVAGGVAGLITSRMAGSDASAGSSGVSAEQEQAASVNLCVEYAAVTRSIPNPADAPGPVLTGVNGLRWALANNPDAGAAIREAITAVLDEYDGMIISFTNVQPPGIANGNGPISSYDPAAAQQAVNHVLDVCQFSGPRH